MRGNLSEFNVESLLQVLGSSRATGALEIAHSTGRHFVAYLESGRLVHAQYDMERGVDALAALMLEQSGTFEFKPGLESPEQTIRGAAEWTLMSAMNKADTRPPALRGEVTIKRKTGNASLNASTPGALGRATRPADSPAPRTVKSVAGSDTTKLEALETMLKGSIFNVNLGAGARMPQQSSRNLNINPPTSKPTGPQTISNPFETREALKVDLEFDALELDKPEPEVPVRPVNPTNATNPSGSMVSTTAQGVAFIPVKVRRATDAADKRSMLPARIVRDWQQQLGRQVVRMEFRIDLGRRGLVLPVAADDTPEDALVLPIELADRLKLASGVVVWVGPG